jgi:hypothetical protein
MMAQPGFRDNAGNTNTILNLLSGETQTFGYDTLHRITLPEPPASPRASTASLKP